jgi:hypothetical protein
MKADEKGSALGEVLVATTFFTGELNKGLLSPPALCFVFDLGVLMSGLSRGRPRFALATCYNMKLHEDKGLTKRGLQRLLFLLFGFHHLAMASTKMKKTNPVCALAVRELRKVSIKAHSRETFSSSTEIPCRRRVWGICGLCGWMQACLKKRGNDHENPLGIPAANVPVK